MHESLYTLFQLSATTDKAEGKSVCNQLICFSLYGGRTMCCAKNLVVPCIAAVPRALLLSGQRVGWGSALRIIAASFAPSSACPCFIGER